MKKAKEWFVTFFIIVILTGIYIALAEQLTIANVLIGFGISYAAIFLTQKIFLREKYLKAFTINRYYLIYLAQLFILILSSAVVSLKYIFSKAVFVKLIEYKTKLSDDNLKAMLANAITLTPGTVTAAINGDTIEVMKLCNTKDVDHTCGFIKIEKVILYMEEGDEK